MQLHFKQLGRGGPLVLLHGLFGQADNWLGVAPKLAERFHVFIPDLRNHGQSPHAPVMDYPLMAADVDRFLAEHGIGRADILGHSLGGKVAMQLALDFPARVSRLVVADMAPRAYSRSHDPIFAALLALELPAFQTRGELETALAPTIPSLNLRRFLLKNLGRDAQGKFFWRMNLRGLAENYAWLCEALPGGRRFAGPTLFLRGGKSDYVTAADEAEIRQFFPAAEFQTIAAAHHWIHADAPAEFVRRVLDFL